MDPTTLVERDVEVGHRQIVALDSAGFPVVAAFWYQQDKEDEWTLKIATPRVDDEGYFAAYTKVREARQANSFALPLMRLSVVSPNDDLVRTLRYFAGTPGAPFLGGKYYHRSPIGGTFVNGAYVYRAERFLVYDGTQHVTAVVRDKQKKAWIAYLCELTLKDGDFHDVKVEGYEWRQRRSKYGLNLRLDVFTQQQTKKGQTIGNVERWDVSNGRLLSVETRARGVTVQAPSEPKREAEVARLNT